MRKIDSSIVCFFFFSSRRRHTRLQGDWSSDVCSSDLCRHGSPTGCATCRSRCSPRYWRDRKSTRLNSSHLVISYAVFCLKKKKKKPPTPGPALLLRTSRIPARDCGVHVSCPACLCPLY